MTQVAQAPIKVRYCLYARKSTESEERQVLSIDLQIKEILELAEREGLEIVAMKRESHSAKETRQRSVFNEIVDEIRAKKYNAMILGSQAKLENDNRGVNVKRGLRTRVEMGLWPGVAPLGYLNQRHMDKKCQVVVDPDKAPIVKKMFEKVTYEK
jgi:site-specific DNA recombinase